MKWEDKLLGWKFTLVTDHKSLEYFKTQLILSPRQIWWWEYLSCFNCDTIHMDGDWNRVADTLSHYFEYDTIEDKHPNTDFVKADKILGPDRELVPIEQFVEIHTTMIRRLCQLQDCLEPAITESKELNQAPKNPTSVLVSGNNDVIATSSGNDKTSLIVKVEQTFNLTKMVKVAYWKDKLYSNILEKPKAHAFLVVKMVWSLPKIYWSRTYSVYPVKPFKMGGRWSKSSLIMHTP